MERSILVRKIIFTVCFLVAIMSGSLTCFADGTPADPDGWVNTPLSDTAPFNTSCEYRYWLGSTAVYPSTVLPGAIIAHTSNGAGNIDVVFATNKYYYNISKSGDYAHPTRQNVQTLTKLEMRCVAPDTTPSGAIMLFNSSTCPVGWTNWKWPFGSSSCTDDSSCNYQVCKKL